MYDTEQIKQLLTPVMVAQHYLGQGKIRSNRIWYKSPFRNERTPSFMVTMEGFHDFGDGWHGDIINFVEEYYNTDFISAMKILIRDFGLPDDEPISKELEKYLTQRREEEKQIRINLDKWFYSTFNKTDDKLKTLEAKIPYLKKDDLQKEYLKRKE